MERIAAGYKHDSFFKDVSSTRTMNKDKFYWTKDGLLVVPDVDTLRTDIMKEMHAPAYSGHVGTSRTTQAITKTFYWKELTSEQLWHSATNAKETNRPTKDLLAFYNR